MREYRKRRVTAIEFEAVRPFLKHISDNRLEAARQVLVDGDTYQAVGDRFGWKRQAVGDVIGAVWRAIEAQRESQRMAKNAGTLMPPGWEQVTLIAPSHLIEKFRREIADASTAPAPEATSARQPGNRKAKPA